MLGFYIENIVDDVFLSVVTLSLYLASDMRDYKNDNTLLLILFMPSTSRLMKMQFCCVFLLCVRASVCKQTSKLEISGFYKCKNEYIVGMYLVVYQVNS